MSLLGTIEYFDCDPAVWLISENSENERNGENKKNLKILEIYVSQELLGPQESFTYQNAWNGKC